MRFNPNARTAGRDSRSGVRTTRLSAVAWALVAAIVGALTIGVSVTAPAQAAALVACDGAAAHDQNSLRVTPSHGTVFYIDSGQGQSLDAAYTAYRITNTDSAHARDDLWVAYDSFTGGVIGLANPADAIQPLGDLAASGSATSFALLKATSSTSLAQSHVVHVYEGKPGTSGATELYSCTFTFAKVAETIKAAANKVTSLSSTTVSTIGSTMTVTVEGNTGTIGAGNATDGSMMWFTPAARSAWPTQALRLESTNIQLYSNNGRTNLVGTYANQLRIPTVSGSKYYYTATYTFRIIGTSSTPASVVPIAQISSGTQIKHTDLGSISSATLSTNTTAVNVAVTKSTSRTVTIADGRTTFSYTVTLANSGGAVTLDSIIDTRSAGLDFVTGSASFAGSAIADPTATGGDPNSLVFSGPFALPAGTSGAPSVRTLTYQLSIVTCAGTFHYTNSATAGIGSIVIGSDSSHVSVSHALGTCGATTIDTYTEDQSLDPEVVTSPATTIGTTTARLNGLVDPNGTSGDSISFSYGTSPTLAGATTVTVGTTTTATTPYAVLADLTGLSTGTLYYFRVSAGTVDGDILSFVTTEPVGTPTVTTLSPTGVTTAGAVTFNGTVDPNLVTNGAKVKFQYALDSSGGACTSLGSVSTTGFAQSETDTGTTDAVYTGAFPSDVSVSLTGLTSGARYCYRTVAYYNPTTANWSLSVASDTWMPVLITTKTAQSITFPTPSDGTVGQTVDAAATASSGLAVVYTTSTPSVCSVSAAGVITLLSSGICSLTADQPGNDAYTAAAPVTVTFTVAKATQTIAFSPVSTVASGDPVALEGTATSGLPLSYSAGPSDVCHVDGDHLATGPGFGTCTIVASQGGNDAYLAAPDVTRTIDVQPAPPSITTTELDPGVVGSPYEIFLEAAGGTGVYSGWELTFGTLPAGLTFDESTGRIWGTPTVVGEITLRFTVTSGGQTSVERELVLTVTKPTPVITATDLEFVYGDDDRATGASTTSGGGLHYEIADESIVTEDGGVLHVVGVGTTTILVVSEETDDYAATSVTITVTVSPATLVVTAPSPSVTYGDAPPSYEPDYSGFVLGEGLADVSSGAVCSSSYSETSAAGSDPAVVCLGAAAANYDIVYVDGVVHIAKAPQRITLVPDALVEMPPGSTQSFAPSALGGVEPVVSTTGDCTWSGDLLTAGATEGDCELSVSVPESENYLAAGPVSRTVSIVVGALLPRTLTLELDVPGTEHSILDDLHLVTTVGPVPATTTWEVDAASTDICRLEDDGTITLLAIGECTIHAAIEADAEYSAATATLTFEIVRAPRLLALEVSRLTAPAGATALATALPSVGGGTLSYRLVGDLGHCTLAGDVITAVSVGTCDIAADITSDDRYEAASSAIVRVEVILASGSPAPGPNPAPSQGPADPENPGEPGDGPVIEPVAHPETPGPLEIRPLGRLPLPSPASVPPQGGPARTNSSIDTIDIGHGIQPAGSDDLSSARRSPAELAGENLAGFAPGVGVLVQVTGARTAAQFAIGATGLDEITIRAAIEESRARLSADFARVSSAIIGDTPSSDDVLGGALSADALRVFDASGLDEPMLVGDLPIASGRTWVTVSGSVHGYLPGSVVYLAITTQPVIVAAAVVGRDGTAELSGAVPADLLPAGGHNIRIVGTRSLTGVTTGADGSLQLDTAAMTEIERFDPGTQATVEIVGVNPTGGTHTVERIVLLGLQAPWWTVMVLGAVALVLLGLLVWRRPERSRWRVLAAVVIVAVTALPALVGWFGRSYDVATVGLVLGALTAIAAIWAPTLRERSRRGSGRRRAATA